MDLASDDSADPVSDTLRRALDALMDGHPIPDDARARLSDVERAHLAGLVATTALTRSVLAVPIPPPASEEASLQRAQERVLPRPGGVSAEHGEPPPAAPRNWLARWWRKQRVRSGRDKNSDNGGRA